MARKHSGEIVTRTIRQRQKNGDIYVIERKTQYDPEKKYNVVLSSKIVGKIPLGQNQRKFRTRKHAFTAKQAQRHGEIGTPSRGKEHGITGPGTVDK